MLQLAIKAQLPMVAVHTRDTLNLPEVLKALTGKKAEPFTPSAGLAKNRLYFVEGVEGLKVPLTSLYVKMVDTQSTLVIVNPKAVVEPMFNAGEVPVPRKMVHDFVTEVISDAKAANGLLSAMGGCTLKEVAELCRLTMERDHSLTAQGFTQTRKDAFTGERGMTQIDTKQAFYSPPDMLIEWALKEKPFFHNEPDVRLRPRGLLLDGPPGTGKTEAAKWIAAQFGVPLYRVDIGGTKAKYVGMSEENMLISLRRLDHEEPCVALIDEVEKVFNTGVNDTSGTTSSMLSQLLWWLAEHKSRVLVIMTTNKASALPKELYREGRIDGTMLFEGLERIDAASFIAGLVKTFKGKSVTQAQVKQIIDEVYGAVALTTHKRPQALIATTVYNFLKGASSSD